MTLRPVLTTEPKAGERLYNPASEVLMHDYRSAAPVVVLRECPDALYPGPIDDGVQTYYGFGRDMPEGWGWRRYEGGYARWVSPDRVVQCHPPVEPKPPRTERVAWHQAWRRKTPDGRTIGLVGRYSTGHVAVDAEGDPTGASDADGTVGADREEFGWP